MTNKGFTLDSILKKAATFSKQIENVHSLSNQIKEEKTACADKEASLENDLFALVNSLHEFQQETISTLSELYARMQAEAEKKAEPEPPAEVVKEIEPEPVVEKPPEPELESEPQIEEEEEVAIEVKTKVEVKESKFEKKEKKAVKKEAPQKKDEEIYLFDL